MSWHHGDYLLLAQAFAGLLAVFAAILVVFIQERHERLRQLEQGDKDRRNSLVHARLISTALSLQMGPVIACVSANSIYFERQSQSKEDFGPELVLNVVQRIRAVPARPSAKTLVDLLPLGEECVASLVVGFALFDMIKDSFETNLDVLMKPHAITHRAYVAANAAVYSQHCIHHLEISAKHLSSVALWPLNFEM